MMFVSVRGIGSFAGVGLAGMGLSSDTQALIKR